MIFFNISYHPNMLYFLIYYIIKRYYIIPLHYINPIYYIIPIHVLYHRVKNLRYFEIEYCIYCKIEFCTLLLDWVLFSTVRLRIVRESLGVSVECLWSVCMCLLSVCGVSAHVWGVYKCLHVSSDLCQCLRMSVDCLWSVCTCVYRPIYGQCRSK